MAAKKTVRRKERRRLSRADAALSMRVEGGSGDGGLVPIVTESRNISGSGVYCFSPHYLAPLSKVALTIVLPAVSGRTPSQRLLKCEGLVVRCLAGEGARKDRAYQLACSFVGLEPVTRDRLEEYVVWRNIQSLRKATGTAARRRAPGRRPATATARKATATARKATATVRKATTIVRKATAGRSGAATGAGAAARATPRKRRTVH